MRVDILGLKLYLGHVSHTRVRSSDDRTAKQNIFYAPQKADVEFKYVSYH